MSWGYSNGFNSYNGFSNYRNNRSLLAHICEFVGETVTIFTKSGGLSGCGFTGTVLSVNCDFVRLVTHRGSAPTNPIGGPNSSCCPNIGGDFTNGYSNDGYGNCNYNCNNYNNYPQPYTVGSVCDIPVDKIAAFCHNAI